MTIQHQSASQADILHIIGEIDVYNAGEILALVSRLASEGRLNILLNMESVSYIDSSGLTTMLDIVSSIQKKKGRLILCYMHPTVRRILDQTRLDSFFDICATVEEAMQKLNV